MKIHNIFSYKEKYGLLIADNQVDLISWKKGVFELIGVFSNDDDGVVKMSDFLQKNAKRFSQQPFYVLVNVIGEDYRFEKTAHLLGKYKTDLHAKRMQQLFRGSRFSVSEVQGRDELGRRDDFVLFSGILTEQKVAPWANLLSRDGHYLAGVHMLSHLLSGAILSTVGGSKKGNSLLLTFHEHGFLRQTFFSNGHLRFSRVSKVAGADVGEISASIKKELERTLQYLTSLKISLAGGLVVRVISPGNMTGQLRESFSNSERIKFDFHDAGQLAEKIGIQNPIRDLGKDSSLPMHIMFSSLRFRQLANPQLIIYYWIQLLTKVSVAAMVVYALFGYWNPLLQLKTGYGYTSETSEVSDKVKALERKIRSEIEGVIGEPPSSPSNMEAISNLYNIFDSISTSPTKLLYYIGQALRRNNNVVLTEISWQVTNSSINTEENSRVLLSGEDIYQIAIIKGIISPIGNRETYRDVSQRAKKLVSTLDAREDMLVEVIEIPADEISLAGLSGSLSAQEDVEAPESRDFELRIIWKEYDKLYFDRVIKQL